MFSDRKVWVPQLAMILTFLITTYVGRKGLDLPLEIQGAISTVITMAVGGIVTWLTPASREEVKALVDNSIIKEAQADPNSKVDLSKVIDDRIVRQAQLDPDSDVSYVIPPVPVPAGEEPTIKR